LTMQNNLPQGVALNIQNGIACIVVDAGVRVADVLTLDVVSDITQIDVTVGQNAHAAWLMRTGDMALNMNINLTLEAGATLDGALLCPENSADVVLRTHVTVNENACWNSFCMNHSDGEYEHHIQVDLQGEHAKAHLYGLYQLDNKAKSDKQIRVVHHASNTHSDVMYKGVVDGKAHAVFYDKAVVQKNIHTVSAHQLNRNILLSPYACVNSLPILEIYADDVQCTHGSTTGQLDDEVLFYLQSRGVPKVQARDILLAAFTQEVFEKITNSSLQKAVHKEGVL
jgi:Fe-S cluster assembly protein SufD